MVNFQDIFGNLMFATLFLVGIMGFILVVQSDNNAAQPIIQNPIFNNSYGNLQNSLSSLESTSQIQYRQFTEETPQLGFGAIILFGIVSTGKVFGNTVLSTFVIVAKLPILVLGLPDSLFSTIASWLVISLIVSAWILYKVGG